MNLMFRMALCWCSAMTKRKFLTHSRMPIRRLGRYQSNPGIEHWKAVKKVLCYLQGSKDYRLTYRRTNNLEIIGYSNSTYACCKDTRRSISGYVFMLYDGPISWKSHKQSLVTSSTMETEYITCNKLLGYNLGCYRLQVGVSQ